MVMRINQCWSAKDRVLLLPVGDFRDGFPCSLRIELEAHRPAEDKRRFCNSEHRFESESETSDLVAALVAHVSMHQGDKTALRERASCVSAVKGLVLDIQDDLNATSVFVRPGCVDAG